MIQTIRVLWRRRRWNQPLNFNWPVISADSVVHICVSEAKRVYGMYFGVPIIQRFLGAARIEVRNVSPHAGGVTFFVYVDWDEELDITTDITVFDPPVLIHDTGENQTWSPASQVLGTRTQKFIMKNLPEDKAKQLQELILKDATVAAKVNATVTQHTAKPEKKPKRKKKS